MSARYDVAVIGAGILGLASARELLHRRPGMRVVVLDGASRVAAEQSGHNSGVIHAGVYYAPGSLKARLCVSGAAALYDYCQRHGIEARRVGKLIIAVDERELPGLDEIERRARANGVPGIRRLAGDEIAAVEPAARGLSALHSPATGVVDFRAVCRQLAADVQETGGELRLSWPVAELRRHARGVRILGGRDGEIEAALVVACAGLQSDRLAVADGGPADPRILPFRGGYHRLRAERRELVRGLIYPVPNPALPFLGIHLTRSPDGEVLVGPSALLAPARDAYRLRRVRWTDLVDTLAWPGTWHMIRRWWRVGGHELGLALSRKAFAAQAARYVPELRAEDLVPAGAGVRAQAVGRDGRLVDDFVVSATGRAIHVRNAPSPGATSSLALAELIADRAEQALR
jgi:(S)-2-hydroxyglutarate dehydrogenase